MINAVLLPIAEFYILWVLYLGVMNLKRVHDTVGLTGPAKWLGMPLVFVAILWDWLCNWTAATILFLQLPATWSELVTGRLKRYKAEGSGWRYKIAVWFALILDAFDPSGRHV